MDQQSKDIRHLLARFGLGYSAADAATYGSSDFNSAVNKLLETNGRSRNALQIADFVGQNGNVNLQVIQLWWPSMIVLTEDPLREAMTLFWHDHFATSAQKVTQVGAMVKQNTIFYRHGLGSFKNLITLVSKDPAMIFWLDNQFNQKGKPNENFAREIMELFTLGVGNYTEKDVQEAARAFTGWGYGANRRRVAGPPRNNAEFLFSPDLHDGGIKSVLNEMGHLTGEMVIDLLCRHPQTSRYLTKKIWEWFVYPNPSETTIERHAKVFRNSDTNISALLKSIMLDPEFLAPKSRRRLYKNPADFCLTTLRQLGVGQFLKDALTAEQPDQRRKNQARTAIVLANRSMRAMGMELFLPPDVAGWEGKEAWISSATMIERIKWADTLFGSPSGARVQSLGIDGQRIIGSCQSHREAVLKLVDIFDAELSQKQVDRLVAAASALGKLPSNRQGWNALASTVTRGIFSSPEFQLK